MWEGGTSSVLFKDPQKSGDSTVHLNTAYLQWNLQQNVAVWNVLARQPHPLPGYSFLFPPLSIFIQQAVSIMWQLSVLSPQWVILGCCASADFGVSPSMLISPPCSRISTQRTSSKSTRLCIFIVLILSKLKPLCLWKCLCPQNFVVISLHSPNCPASVF